jgi:hypothetical protein
MKVSFAALALAALLVSVLGFSTISRADTIPSGFVGSYELSKDKYGLCEPTLEVFELESSGGYSSLTMGPFFFDRVGGGVWVDDDTVEKVVNETRVVGSSQIVHVSKIHDKGSGTNYLSTTKATLNGDLLDIRSTYRGGVLNTLIECVYRRIAN